jgi:hypothetical protein
VNGQRQNNNKDYALLSLMVEGKRAAGINSTMGRVAVSSNVLKLYPSLDTTAPELENKYFPRREEGTAATSLDPTVT